MSLYEVDTRAKLMDSALHTRSWTEDLIRREETAGAVKIMDRQPRRRSNGRMDYALRVEVTREAQPAAVTVIEDKAEISPPGHSGTGKLYIASSPVRPAIN